MSVPILTIPETAFDPSRYHSVRRARQSRLLRFIFTLTRTSALALVVAYIVGFLTLRPLMETTTDQRIEFLEVCRAKLRDFYLKAISKVEYIPIIGIERSNGKVRKIYADSVCQTVDLESQQHAESARDALGQVQLVDKLSVLKNRLRECSGYSVQEMEHYKVIDFAIKDLRQKTELVYFDQTKLFTESGPTASRKPRHVAREVKQGIRSVKGMFMSGRG